jgi:predicted permease
MTFVINLAVPPLLFAQVLYGRALYTSSVLIGLYWISIIGLLMLAYWLLYRSPRGLRQGARHGG